MSKLLEASKNRIQARRGKMKELHRLHEAMAREGLENAIAKHRNDVYGQMEAFFVTTRVPSAIGRVRTISTGTQAKYVQAVRLMVKELAERNIQIRNLNEISAKHLVIVIQAWEDKGLSASSISTRYTCLKRLLGWMGKGGHLGAVRNVVVKPESSRRQYSATAPKAWEARGVDLLEMLPAIDKHCPYFGAQLRLCHQFGLRVLEAVAMKPHESDCGHTLLVIHGTKGGRRRTVPIDTPEQRAALDYCKAVANKAGFLRGKGLKQEGSRRRFYDLMHKFGFTREALGVTGHGLRHGYANRQYKQMTGADAPVNHGEKVPHEIELAARREVSLFLGHTRPEIVTAYTGSHINIARHQRKNMERLLTKLQNRRAPLAAWAHHRMAELAGRDIELQVHVVGPDADGIEVAGAPLNMALTLLPRGGANGIPVDDELILACSKAAREITGRACVVQDGRLVPPEMPRLELIFSV